MDGATIRHGLPRQGFGLADRIPIEPRRPLEEAELEALERVDPFNHRRRTEMEVTEDMPPTELEAAYSRRQEASILAIRLQRYGLGKARCRLACKGPVVVPAIPTRIDIKGAWTEVRTAPNSRGRFAPDEVTDTIRKT